MHARAHTHTHGCTWAHMGKFISETDLWKMTIGTATHPSCYRQIQHPNFTDRIWLADSITHPLTHWPTDWL